MRDDGGGALSAITVSSRELVGRGAVGASRRVVRRRGAEVNLDEAVGDVKHLAVGFLVEISDLRDAARRFLLSLGALGRRVGWPQGGWRAVRPGLGHLDEAVGDVKHLAVGFLVEISDLRDAARRFLLSLGALGRRVGWPQGSARAVRGAARRFLVSLGALGRRVGRQTVHFLPRKAKVLGGTDSRVSLPVHLPAGSAQTREGRGGKGSRCVFLCVFCVCVCFKRNETTCVCVLNGTKRQNAIRNSAFKCSGNGTAGGRMRDDGGGALSDLCVCVF